MARRSRPDPNPQPPAEPELRPLRKSEMEALKGGAQPGPTDVNPDLLPWKPR